MRSSSGAPNKSGLPRFTVPGIFPIALSPDGKTLASGSWEGEIRLWNLADGKPIRTILAASGYKPEGNAQAAAR